MNEILYIVFVLVVMIVFTMINYIVIDILLRKYLKNIGVSNSQPLRCSSLTSHNFVKNKCSYCGKMLDEIMKGGYKGKGASLKLGNTVYTLDEIR